MTRTRKILYAILIVLVIIQFIRPSRNNGEAESENFISKKYALPENVKSILKQSCFDCHSNHTNYPWYANIQPVGWWIQYSHINDGKRHLNFSEFANYPEKRSKKKLEEIAEEIREGGMPLESYTMLHSNSLLNDDQKKSLIDWAESLK